MNSSEVIRAWGRILKGERPSLSIEITRECPLRCPGCYAYDDAHLGGGATLRSLNDRKGQALIDGVLEVVDRIRPLHLSLVGGDPLVRHRELESMIPQLLERGIHVQVVTSAFRPLAAIAPRECRGVDRRAPARARRPASPRHIRSDPLEHCRPDRHDPLYGHRSDDEAARLFEGVSRVLDPTSGGP